VFDKKIAGNGVALREPLQMQSLFIVGERLWERIIFDIRDE
jgi:uncharacterized membrane protein